MCTGSLREIRFIHFSIPPHTDVYIYVCVCVCVCVCVYVYIYMCVYIYIYIYTNFDNATFSTCLQED